MSDSFLSDGFLSHGVRRRDGDECNAHKSGKTGPQGGDGSVKHFGGGGIEEVQREDSTNGEIRLDSTPRWGLFKVVAQGAQPAP